MGPLRSISTQNRDLRRPFRSSTCSTSRALEHTNKLVLLTLLGLLFRSLLLLSETTPREALATTRLGVADHLLASSAKQTRSHLYFYTTSNASLSQPHAIVHLMNLQRVSVLRVLTSPLAR